MSLYETLETLLERPAMRVSRARRQDGRAVVLKCVAADADPETQTRLRKEYELLRGIDLPGVIDAVGLTEEGGDLVLALEDIGGESLDRLVPAGEKLALGQFLDLAAGLTETLAGLHRRGIVHRGINPAHIVVNRASGQFRLIGFGDADALGQREVELQPPAAIGKGLAYIAPEQTGRMNRRVDHRSDFYSLGATLYRLLVGRPPFTADDELDQVHQHITVMPQPPHALDDEVPVALSKIVMKLMAKMADDRYQSGDGLRADLEHCRRDLAEGVAPDFALGREDFSDRLQLPQKLYGRRAEIDRLMAAIERSSRGGRELLLVAGYAGVGKTALVHESCRLIAGKHGHFIEGKFDQLQRSEPYFGWIQAFSGLVRYILMEREAQLAHWRRVILAAVGSVGRVLTDVIPKLELVIGPQPEVPTLPPAEAQNRFNYVFLELFKAIARPEHPLLVFLDDLQWIDSASLGLLHTLLTGAGAGNLLVVGAYRDNEVDALHPLTTGFEALVRAKAAVETMKIGDLTEETANELIADAVQREPAGTAALTRLVFSRTGGNPFFLHETLKALAEKRVLFFDGTSHRWQWDISAIERTGITDNVVTLLLEKIRQLSPRTQHLLSLAACIGFRFRPSDLSAVTGQSEADTIESLQPALGDGLIIAGADHHQFAHDRLWEAAYAIIPAGERPAKRLAIGQRLLAHTPEDGLAENVFEIVGHLNEGIALITRPEEREQLAELNLLAGKQAKAATAYASAVGFLGMGAALVDSETWEQRHDLAFDLHLEQAECEYLTGNYERSDELLDVALDRARSLLDRVWVYRLRQRLYQFSGRWPEAVSTALKGLELFGVSFPQSDEEIRTATEAELSSIQANLKGHRIADLTNVPLTDDAEVQALLGLLAEAMPQCYIVRYEIWPLIVAKTVNLTLQRGHVEDSPYIYSTYCMMLVGLYDDTHSAFQFSQMSLALNERLPRGRAMRGRLLFFHAAVVNIWCRHFATSLPLLDEAFQALLDAGDLIWASYLTYHAPWMHLENGASLEEVGGLARQFADFNLQHHNDVILIVNQVENQFALSLQGKTRSLTDFSDATFDEAGLAETIEQAGFGVGVAYYCIMKQIAAFIAGSFDEALAWGKRAAPVLPNVSSMAIWGTYHFYNALTLTAVHQQASGQEQQEIEQALGGMLEKLEIWANSCPENFANRYALVSAEIARIEERHEDAMELYERAIASAHENGFVHNEAVACETAAAYYRQRGHERIARTYLAEAAACYSRWGAAGKVRQLETLHPWIALAMPAGATTLAERLDALSLAKVQRAISSEIHQDRLAETLLRIVLENAGAQTGVLSVEGAGRLRAEMQPDNEEGRRIVFDSSPIARDMPETIVNYVRRSGETVVLADAAARAGEFAADDYLRRVGPRSVLCMAILRRDKLLAVLYLENNLVSGAFTPGRRAILEALTAQAAVSLEVSAVYEALQESEQRLRLTLEATQIGIFDWDVAHDTWLASPEYYTMLGYVPKRSLADREEWLARVHPDDRAMVEDTIRAVLAGERAADPTQTYEYEARLRRADGAYRWQHVKGFGVKHDEQGRVTRILGVRMDIHERKTAEEALRQLNLELDGRVLERTAQLEAANQELEAFAYSVSHDLRAPVRHIDGYLEMLTTSAGNRLDGQSRRYLGTIAGAARKMGDLIDDLLSFSRTGRQAISFEQVDLGDLVRDIMAELEPDTAERDVDWRIGDLPVVNGDAAMLRVVLVNLVSNALKFTGRQKQARIEIGSPPGGGREDVVFVRDNGAGFDMTHADKLFGVFQRLHREDEFEGTGIGLANVRRIISRHGGRTWGHGNPGEGATFFFALPRAPQRGKDGAS